MGLFRKKKEHKSSVGSVSSADSNANVYRTSSSDVRRDLGARFNRDVEQERLKRESADGNRNAPPHTQSSSKPLKLRLKKSLGNLFVDKNEQKPPLPTTSSISHERPISFPETVSSQSLQSPVLEDMDSQGDTHWHTENSEPSPIFFTPAFDAPPVPPSPTPQQLAFLESNKSRLSASYQSIPESPPSDTFDPLCPKAKSTTLFERRRPERREQLSLTSIHSVPAGSSTGSRPSFASSQETSISLPAAFRYRRTSSVPSASIWSKEADLLTPATTTSLDPSRRKASNDDSTIAQLFDEEHSERESEASSPSPILNLTSQTERRIANARLSDVLRTLFASNGRMGVNEECKRHLTQSKEPRFMELSLALRTPAMASYADDYPHGKYYCCCSIDAGNVDLKAQEVPLEELHVSQAPFSRLPFPDNFFDIIVSGSMQLIMTKSEWDDMFSEVLRVLKPGGWLDLIITEASLHSTGPITECYNKQLISCLDRRNIYANPGSILPPLLRNAGFREITRTQLMVPIFWRDSDENQVCIRNGKTGEKYFMTMSEVGDRVSTLMHGFWEEMFGEWDDEVEGFVERNRVRRQEAEETKPWSLIVKIAGRKKGRLIY